MSCRGCSPPSPTPIPTLKGDGRWGSRENVMLAAKFARNSKRRFPFSFSAMDVPTDQVRLWPMKAAVVIKVPWNGGRTDGREEKEGGSLLSFVGRRRRRRLEFFLRARTEKAAVSTKYLPQLYSNQRKGLKPQMQS